MCIHNFIGIQLPAGFGREEKEEEKKSVDEGMVGGTSGKCAHGAHSRSSFEIRCQEQYFYIRTNFIRTMSLDLTIKTENLRTTYEQILSRNASPIRKWKT